MGYQAPTWVNNGAPSLSAENMQQISNWLEYCSNNMVNPNILDNGNFQVWQRYPEGTYTGVPYNEYIADRWRFLSSDRSVTNTITKAGDYGIKNVSGPHMRVNQRLENAAQYNGKTLTLSLLMGDGSLSYNTVVASDWTETTDIFGVFGDELAWLHTGETWLAAKLELGSQQTLAHQENGVWVLNEIPDYGEQLSRCQRYAVRLSKWNRNRATNIEQDIIDFSVPIPTSMRALPVLVDVSKFFVRTISGKVQDGFSLTTLGSSENSVFVRATKTSHGLSDAQLYTENGAMFSAEL